MHKYSPDMLSNGSSFFDQSNSQHKVLSLTSKKCCHVGVHVMFGTSDLGPCVNMPLKYTEDIHWSRILGNWSNMIGYEMVSSPTWVSVTFKASLMKTFKYG